MYNYEKFENAAQNRHVKENKGITLVALIITIIVLLILAMVSISLVMNSGIITKSKSAVDKYSEEEIGEQIKLAYQEYQMSKYTGDQITLQQALDKVFETGVATVTGEGPWKIIVGEKSYTLAVDGTVTPNSSSSSEEQGSDVTGVEYFTLKAGDYVNYPVYYNNVGTNIDSSSGEAVGSFPRDEYSGWRILDVDIENNVVKLVSTGVPMIYYHDNNSLTSVTDLTTNFFSTPINSTLTKYNFYKCGFKEAQDSTTNISNITNVKDLFINKFTQVNAGVPKVQVMSKDELDTAKIDVNSSDYKSNDLLAIPCKENESSEYAMTLLSSKKSEKAMWFVSWDGSLTYGNDLHIGVRPVVTLKSGIKFVESKNKTNNVTTYDIYE